MKYIVILADGMADWPDENGQTPMSLAHKPNIDALAAMSEVGLCQTIPKGMSPGSDTANLAVIGCDPRIYYSGRSPLEALSMGVKLNDGDIAYRVNLVTLSDESEYESKTMLDYSAGEIETEEAAKLIELLQPVVPEGCELFAGISYRHLLVERATHSVQRTMKDDAKKLGIRNEELGMMDAGASNESKQNSPTAIPNSSLLIPNSLHPPTLTPPHDITNKPIADYLPKGDGAEKFLEFMKRSSALLAQCTGDGGCGMGNGDKDRGKITNYKLQITNADEGKNEPVGADGNPPAMQGLPIHPGGLPSAPTGNPTPNPSATYHSSLITYHSSSPSPIPHPPSPLHTANAVWPWGAGTKPNLPSFENKFGIKGAMISAVNLLKGIGVGMGLESIDVPGATGTLTTNFEGKAQAAIDALRRLDFVFVHLEAPDECGHQGDRLGKIRAIELIDEKIVGPILRAFGSGQWTVDSGQLLEDTVGARRASPKNNIPNDDLGQGTPCPYGSSSSITIPHSPSPNKSSSPSPIPHSPSPFKLLLLPDHATPLAIRTHTSDPVPYILFDSVNKKSGVPVFTEAAAKSTGNFVGEGCKLIERMIP